MFYLGIAVLVGRRIARGHSPFGAGQQAGPGERDEHEQHIGLHAAGFGEGAELADTRVLGQEQRGY